MIPYYLGATNASARGSGLSWRPAHCSGRRASKNVRVFRHARQGTVTDSVRDQCRPGMRALRRSPSTGRRAESSGTRPAPRPRTRGRRWATRFRPTPCTTPPRREQCSPGMLGEVGRGYLGDRVAKGGRRWFGGRGRGPGRIDGRCVRAPLVSGSSRPTEWSINDHAARGLFPVRRSASR